MKNNNNEAMTKFLTDKKQNVGDAERIVSGIAGGALVSYGIKAGGLFGTAISLVGGGLLYRGATGHCHVYDATNFSTAEGDTNRKFAAHSTSSRIHVKKSVTINKSAAELYQFWRNFENLPQFMTHLESVKITGEKTSHWVATAPLGTTVEWDAEITSEQENERIGWKSSELSEIPNSGVVEFLPTTNRGTEVKVALTYEPPAGYVGSLVAKLFGEEPNQQVTDDLRRFKRLMESGTIIKTEGQPSGRAESAVKVKSASA